MPLERALSGLPGAVLMFVVGSLVGIGMHVWAYDECGAPRWFSALVGAMSAFGSAMLVGELVGAL